MNKIVIAISIQGSIGDKNLNDWIECWGNIYLAIVEYLAFKKYKSFVL